MKYKNYLFLCIVVVLLFSCNKKKENNSEYVQHETEQVDIEKSIVETEKSSNNGSNTSFALSVAMRESIRSKVTATEEEKKDVIKIIKRSSDFIEKANFGIPGGDNWIVKHSDKYITIYVINDDKIVKEYYATVGGLNFIDQDLHEISEFDIMRDIPGTHLSDGVFSFGDFNGDGIDELFHYFYWYDLGYKIDIFHYDSEKEGFIYCRIPYTIINPKYGPAPVEFITYQGKLGVKVYNEKYHWETETTEEGKWYFYTWDAKQRTYVEIGEVEE